MAVRGLVLVAVAAVLAGCTGSAADGPPVRTTPAVTSPAPVTSPVADAADDAGCAVVRGTARFTGGSWRSVPLPAAAIRQNASLVRVAAAGPRAAWAVGWTPTADGGQTALALDWDGVRWRNRPLPAGISRLMQVVAAGPAEAFAAGYHETRSGAAVPRTVRWDGRRWNAVPVPRGARGGVVALAADGCGRVHLGGHDADGAFVARWRDGRWRLLDRPPGASSGGVGSLSEAPGSRLYAGVSHDNGGELVSWGGKAWRSEKLLAGPHVGLYRVTAFSDREVWYGSNEPFVGGPMAMRASMPNQFFVAELFSGERVDTRALGLDSAFMVSGRSSAEWLYGGGGLALRRGSGWARSPKALPGDFAAVDLGPIPGTAGSWIAGIRAQRPALFRFVPR